MIYVPKPHQRIATQHIIDNEDVLVSGGAGLFLDMGLGKSVSTLTAVVHLLKHGLINKVLVIAPKRVAEHTWREEVEKWDHTRNLRISVCVGDIKKRTAALRVDADIYTINRENTGWLTGLYQGNWPFDMVVIDELSSFKNQASNRFKALRVVRPFIKRTVGLTGTPAGNGLIDLWSQLYLLDRGKRLGTTITGYRDRYFEKDYSGFKYIPRQPHDSEIDILGKDYYKKEIYDRIGDICVSMSAKDWLELPERIDRDHIIEPSKQLISQYREFEREAVLSLGDEEINALNAAALTNKLLQFANGAVYNEERQYREVHDMKIERLEEILEEANGQPFLLFYNFKHDVARIKKYLKQFGPHELGGPKDIDKWNRGEIPFLLAHPASAGHGLNMQYGGHLMGWFGLPWSLELYKQACARLDRQGQKESVINNRLLLSGTFDQLVLRALNEKDGNQNELMNAIKAVVDKYRN